MKKLAFFLLLIIIFLFVILWSLTGKWMADGKTPAATGKYEYAVVLGAKVNGKTPSLSLQYRLEAALQYSRQYPDVKLILSGGKGPGEDISEAEAMKRWLTGHGLEADRIIVEDQSTTTYENILFSKELLPPSVKGISIITSDYHLARARNIAQRLGLDSDAVEATTPKIVQWKLTTRERLALLKDALLQ